MEELGSENQVFPKQLLTIFSIKILIPFKASSKKNCTYNPLWY